MKEPSLPAVGGPFHLQLAFAPERQPYQRFDEYHLIMRRGIPMDNDKLIENMKRNVKNGRIREDINIEKLREDKMVMRLINEAQKSVDQKSYTRESLLNELLDEVKGHATICGSYLKTEGAICMGEPYLQEDGSTNGRCIRHGGKSTGPTWKKKEEEALKKLHPTAKMLYLITMDRFIFTKEEEDFYIYSMNSYIEEYQLDTVNIMLLDRALRNFFMNARREYAEAGEQVNESKSMSDFDTKSLRYFQALGLDRKFNKSITNADNPQKVDLATLFMVQDAEPEDARKVIDAELKELDEPDHTDADEPDHTDVDATDHAADGTDDDGAGSDVDADQLYIDRIEEGSNDD